jgi:catechol 2,3-dioxygenase-like lactoylglutathione lyase family enzyme
VQIDELVLDVPDPVATGEFYARVLQLPVEQAGADAVVQAGRTRLVLRPSAQGRWMSYHIAFGVSLAHFDALRRTVAARTPLITAGGEDVIVHSNWDAVAFYFRDPAGNILECIAHRAGPSGGAGEAGAATIQSVCEVGVVVDDVPATARELGGALRAAPFRGEPDADFGAVGTERGLLIVVRRGREWYPSTGVSAEAAPLRLAVTSEDGARHAVEGPPYRVVAASGTS